MEFIICDDNKNICESIKNVIDIFCKRNEIESKITFFYDYDQLFIKFVKNNNARLIYILDIEMPSESGIDMARLIRKYDRNSIIIFLTSHNEMAYSIICERINALTFISKMNDYKSNFYKALKQCQLFLKPNNYLIFNENNNNYSINMDNILYLTKDDRKTIIVTNNGEYSVYTSLNKINSLLSKDFVKTHRACIVNLNRVEKIDFNRKVIYFDNGLRSDLLGDKYKKEVSELCKI